MIQLTSYARQRQEFKPRVGALLESMTGTCGLSTVSTKHINDELQVVFPHLTSNHCWSLQTQPSASLDHSLRIGVLFSGGPAPGGHNVLAGLLDAMIQLHPASQLLGFSHGFLGLLECRYQMLTPGMVEQYRNMGGFDLLGTGRLKLISAEQFEKCRAVALELDLQGLVIIGGDDSQTNAAYLAEDFLSHQIDCCVIGIPKTIDGDMRGLGLEMTFGHDSACRIYSELIGNIARDAISSDEYYHFIRLMGRSASHITLECALHTKPSWVIIAEEIQDRKMSLDDVVNQLVHVIIDRKDRGLNSGTILIPEGLLEFIPSFKEMIQEPVKNPSWGCLPQEIQEQLLQRDAHGNIQLSQVETEKLLMRLVQKKLKEKGIFQAMVGHFLGYEARAGLPSDFDVHYAYGLGRVSAYLLKARASGVMATLTHLHEPPEQWIAQGVPLLQFMQFETRQNKRSAFIQKACVDLNHPSFQYLSAHRQLWAQGHSFCYGPYQSLVDKANDIKHTPPLSIQLGAGNLTRGELYV